MKPQRVVGVSHRVLQLPRYYSHLLPWHRLRKPPVRQRKEACSALPHPAYSWVVSHRLPAGLRTAKVQAPAENEGPREGNRDASRPSVLRCRNVHEPARQENALCDARRHAARLIRAFSSRSGTCRRGTGRRPPAGRSRGRSGRDGGCCRTPRYGSRSG